jgi:mediator of RNA polymerase II transcription subunit 7
MSSIQPQSSKEDIESVNDVQPKNSSAAVKSNEVADGAVSTAAGEAQLLVSEFPPPPYYFRLASMQGGGALRPPPIPTDAIVRGTKKAAEIAARTREAERQQRLAELRRGDDSQGMEDDKTDSILGGVVKTTNVDDHDDGDVVAVFGEVIEDPILIEPLDYCDDPIVVRDEVKRLHQIVLRTFVKMVQELVHKPLDSKYVLCVDV